MPDPTIADLIGCNIEGYVVTGYREPYGQVVIGGFIFDTADEARDEAGQWAARSRPDQAGGSR